MQIHSVLSKLSYAKGMTLRSMICDVVCGKEIDHPTKYMNSHQGAAYFFCSEACKGKFESNPARYERPLGEPVLRHKIA